MATGTSQAAETGVSKGTASKAKTGLKITRYFSRAGVSPYDEIDWELRTASIINEKGKVVFEQANVEIPKAWSLMATQVVVSKYFRGPLGTPHREHRVRQMIGRVVETNAGWGKKDGYFATDEDARTFCCIKRPALTAQSGLTAASKRSPSAPLASSLPSKTRWTQSSTGTARKGSFLKAGPAPA